MVTKDYTQKNTNRDVSVDDHLETNDFCNECLYSWCSKRDKVSYCTMKSKGLFECRSCMIKLMSAYEKEILISAEIKIAKKEKISSIIYSF